MEVCEQRDCWFGDSRGEKYFSTSHPFLILQKRMCVDADFLCPLNQTTHVSGVCDGGAVDAGVSGGEFSRMSEEQRPYGSSNQVRLCYF